MTSEEALTKQSLFNIKYYNNIVNDPTTISKLEKIKNYGEKENYSIRLTDGEGIVLNTVKKELDGYLFHLYVEQNFNLPVKIEEKDETKDVKIENIFDKKKKGTIGHDVFIHIKFIDVDRKDGKKTNIIYTVIQQQRKLTSSSLKYITEILIKENLGLSYEIEHILDYNMMGFLQKSGTKIKGLSLNLKNKLKNEIDNTTINALNTIIDKGGVKNLNLSMTSGRGNEGLNSIELIKMIDEIKKDINLEEGEEFKSISKCEILFHIAETNDNKRINLIGYIMKDNINIINVNSIISQDDALIKIKTILIKRNDDFKLFLTHIRND